MARRHAPAAERNREALLAVLRRVLPERARVLELGSGTGEHAVWLAARLPGVAWQPSDPDPVSRASIEAWIDAAESKEKGGAGFVAPPLALDLLAPSWRLRRADAIVCVNVLHVAPAGATLALVEGARDVLPRGGVLVVAGPFGGRDPAIPPALAAVVAAAERNDLALEETAALPDACACAVFRRR
jgi:SAM-dependent methyltransferase